MDIKDISGSKYNSVFTIKNESPEVWITLDTDKAYDKIHIHNPVFKSKKIHVRLNNKDVASFMCYSDELKIGVDPRSKVKITHSGIITMINIPDNLSNNNGFVSTMRLELYLDQQALLTDLMLAKLNSIDRRIDTLTAKIENKSISYDDIAYRDLQKKYNDLEAKFDLLYSIINKND